MNGIEITALKKEYQQMVLNKQDTYNPDYNSILDDNEIDILKDAAGVKTKEELLASYEQEDLARRIANGIHVKKVIKDGKLDGTYSGGTAGVGFGSDGNVGIVVGGSSGTIEGDITRTMEIDFYEEQHYTDVREPVFKQCFKDLDLDGNGKLSAKEISAYKDYVSFKQSNRYKHDEYDRCYDVTAKPVLWGFGTGVAGAIAGGVATSKLLDRFVEYLFRTGSKEVWDSSLVMHLHRFIDHPIKGKIYHLLHGWPGDGANTIVSRGLILLGAAALASAVGFGIYKLLSNKQDVKEAKEKMPALKANLKESDKQLAKLATQYQNIDG